MTKTHAETKAELLADLEALQKTGIAIADTNRNPVARAKSRSLINRGLVPCGLLFRDQASGEYAGLTVDGKVIWWQGAPAEEKADEQPA